MRKAALGRAAALAFALMIPTLAVAQTDDDARSHKGQFGLHAKVGTGYRGVLRYNEEFCGVSGKDLCLGRSPVALDLGASYRVIEKLELLFEMRFGLERDFGETENGKGPRVSAYAPGLKIYFQDAGTSTFFTTLQMVMDTTRYRQVKDELDLGAKLTGGFQFDVHRTVGLYFFCGPLVSWTHWLRFELEGGLGIQARFP